MAGTPTGSAGKGLKRVFATSLTETTSYDAEGIGALRFEGNKIYKWVKYNQGAGAVAAVAGQVAYYYAPGGVGGDEYANSEVTSDLTDSAEVGAGVLQSAIANGQFGWIQIRGAATLTIALTAGVDGDVLTPTGATDGTLDVTAAATSAPCAFAHDASANKIICDFPF